MKKLDIAAKIPILSWCKNLEEEALNQAINLANHPTTVGFVALMPDCHTGYGMPIGGVIACKNAIIPNAVGVDIGCGMCAVQTNILIEDINKEHLRSILQKIKLRIPMGEGNAHRTLQKWSGLYRMLAMKMDAKTFELAQKNLGTLGGGNHFIEIQKSDNGFIWLMLHSGSRNLGYQIAQYHHNIALDLNKKWHSNTSCDDLAFLPTNSDYGKGYLNDMDYALNYAKENRVRMMRVVKECVMEVMKQVSFATEVNIHHNYASLENHLGQNLWIHRKGATSAKKGQLGIIPGAMGSYSYIVEGLGNPSSFQSCSHGAGRTMSRTKASETLDKEKCEEQMKDIVWDGFKKRKKRKDGTPKYDLSEAPNAYKNINEVIEAQKDLVKILVKLETLAVLKG